MSIRAIYHKVPLRCAQSEPTLVGSNFLLNSRGNVVLLESYRQPVFGFYLELIARIGPIVDFGLRLENEVNQALAKITPSSFCERGATIKNFRPHRLAWLGRMVLSH